MPKPIDISAFFAAIRDWAGWSLQSAAVAELADGTTVGVWVRGAKGRPISTGVQVVHNDKLMAFHHDHRFGILGGPTEGDEHEAGPIRTRWLTPDERENDDA